MNPNMPSSGRVDVPTRFQLAVLNNPPGECGYAEIEMEMLDAPWVAVLSTVRACRRRGWLDDTNNITPAGRAALTEPQS